MMQNGANLENVNDRLMISGDLNFVSVVSLWKESLAYLKNQNKVTIDFSNVTSTNSGGLALIVEWIKWSRENHKELVFVAIPQQILSIAKICGLSSALSHSV